MIYNITDDFDFGFLTMTEAAMWNLFLPSLPRTGRRTRSDPFVLSTDRAVPFLRWRLFEPNAREMELNVNQI